MITIRPGGLDHPAVIELLALHLAELRADTPLDNAHALDLDGLRRPGINFFAGWDGEELLGVAALRALSVDHGEVKSMRTVVAHRGKGVARALLSHLIATASARGYRRLSLETGTAPRFAAANALYEATGFVDCDAFGGYPPSPHNRFMTLSL
ncbi:GNAT family N-acetyltransferase [Sphingomonas bacterium]|uniref:GNAT family N-acetyltransferase n=1 Tax=Sphingomonas bacterium TaxID=1895847 RepID=UPI001C2D47D2|nr:GNAT family N-acetyltransferase [Sphingomonas bacterium]